MRIQINGNISGMKAITKKMDGIHRTSNCLGEMLIELKLMMREMVLILNLNNSIPSPMKKITDFHEN